MNQSKLEILERALEREKRSRKAAEKILESKSAELYNLTQELQDANLKLTSLLRERTSELSGVFENIVDAYVVMDLNGNLLKMNDAATHMLGFESIGTKANLMTLVHPSQIIEVERGMSSLLEKGSISNFEVRVITPNNLSKLLSVNGSVIYTEDGKAIAAQGIVRDITEKRQTDELIREQRNELDIIVNTSPMGIILTDDEKIIRANEGAAKLFGYTIKELESSDIINLSYPDDRKKHELGIEELNKGIVDKFSIVKRYIRKDKTVFWAKTTISSVNRKDGSIKYRLGIIEDITKELEGQLLLEVINKVAQVILGKVNYYEISWEIVQVIAEYLGTNDCVIYINDPETNSLEQVAAYGQKVKGQEVLNKISIRMGEGVVGTVAKTGIGEIISDTSLDPRYIPDDDIRYSEITVPIISGGKVIGIIDSEHRNKGFYTASHLETLTNIARIVSMQLEKAISLAQKEKAEKKSQELLKTVERSNEELREYAHVVSHDLKSPLRSLYALVHWLKEDNIAKLDENSLRNIEIMQKTLENMEQLISDVLEYSSITSERFNFINIDLNELVDNVIRNIQIPKNYVVNIKSSLPVISGDPTRFGQLFQNLIGNAILYNDKEHGIVEIDVKEEETYYQFSVADNGIGIDKKYHEKIFEVFQALSSSKQSTGVGLSIVKKIVEFYQGKIWLESDLGMGTTFFFTLKK
jgi:PAS domain S-box-containing protein